MKRIIQLWWVFTILIQTIFGDCLVEEDFSNFDASASSYSSGTYFSEDNINWEFKGARAVDGLDDIAGRAIGFGPDSQDERLLKASIEAEGLERIQFSMRSWFQSGTAADRILEVLVNGISVGEFALDSMEAVQVRSMDLAVSGDVEIEFRAIGSRQLILDDIKIVLDCPIKERPGSRIISGLESSPFNGNGRLNISWEQSEITDQNLLIVSQEAEHFEVSDGIVYEETTMIESGQIIQYLSGNTTSIEVDDLNPGTRYRVRVIPANNFGEDILYALPERAASHSFVAQQVVYFEDFSSLGNWNMEGGQDAFSLVEEGLKVSLSKSQEAGSLFLTQNFPFNSLEGLDLNIAMRSLNSLPKDIDNLELLFLRRESDGGPVLETLTMPLELPFHPVSGSVEAYPISLSDLPFVPTEFGFRIREVERASSWVINWISLSETLSEREIPELTDLPELIEEGFAYEFELSKNDSGELYLKSDQFDRFRVEELIPGKRWELSFQEDAVWFPEETLELQIRVAGNAPFTAAIAALDNDAVPPLRLEPSANSISEVSPANAWGVWVHLPYAEFLEFPVSLKIGTSHPELFDFNSSLTLTDGDPIWVPFDSVFDSSVQDNQAVSFYADLDPFKRAEIDVEWKDASHAIPSTLGFSESSLEIEEGGEKQLWLQRSKGNGNLEVFLYPSEPLRLDIQRSIQFNDGDYSQPVQLKAIKNNSLGDKQFVQILAVAPQYQSALAVVEIEDPQLNAPIELVYEPEPFVEGSRETISIRLLETWNSYQTLSLSDQTGGLWTFEVEPGAESMLLNFDLPDDAIYLGDSVVNFQLWVDGYSPLEFEVLVVEDESKLLFDFPYSTVKLPPQVELPLPIIDFTEAHVFPDFDVFDIGSQTVFSRTGGTGSISAWLSGTATELILREPLGNNDFLYHDILEAQLIPSPVYGGANLMAFLSAKLLRERYPENLMVNFTNVSQLGDFLTGFPVYQTYVAALGILGSSPKENLESALASQLENGSDFPGIEWIVDSISQSSSGSGQNSILHLNQPSQLLNALFANLGYPAIKTREVTRILNWIMQDPGYSGLNQSERNQFILSKVMSELAHNAGAFSWSAEIHSIPNLLKELFLEWIFLSVEDPSLASVSMPFSSNSLDIHSWLLKAYKKVEFWNQNQIGPFGGYEYSQNWHWSHLWNWSHLDPSRWPWFWNSTFGWVYPRWDSAGVLRFYIQNRGWFQWNSINGPLVWNFNSDNYWLYTLRTENPAWFYNYGSRSWVSY